MAKFDAKKADLNKDGQLSSYEKNRGKATAEAMPMAKGYAMQMGKKEIDSPGTFSTKQSKVMQMSPLLQTENENGMKEVGRNTTSTEKMVQGLLGEETKTTIDLASDPTTTTTTGTRSLDEAFDIAQQTGLTLPGESREEYKVRARKDPSFGQNTQYEKEVVTAPGETAQKKETEFNPYPFKDTYDPFEARQEQRNITASARKEKRAEIKRARAQKKAAKDFTAEEAKAAGLDLGEFAGLTGKESRKQMRKARKAAKLKAKTTTEKGRKGVTDAVSTQIEKAKNPAQTDSYQAKPNNSGSDYKSVFSDAAKRIGNMDSSLGNTDFNMQMKPMQFRKVGYSGKKPGKSGYKK